MSPEFRPPKRSRAGQRTEQDAADAILLRVDPSSPDPVLAATAFHPPARGRSLPPGAKSAGRASATPLPSLPSSGSRPPALAPFPPSSTSTTHKETK